MAEAIGAPDFLTVDLYADLFTVTVNEQICGSARTPFNYKALHQLGYALQPLFLAGIEVENLTIF